jgi:glycosyltransferase involved in cell wall biosynthesis
MSVDAGGARLPTFSVVVPTRDRPQRLATCLAALARLHYPRDRYEIVVVDDGSRQSPAAEVAAVEHRMSVTLLAQAGAGPATARNLDFRRLRVTPDLVELRNIATRAASSLPLPTTTAAPHRNG